jgi:phenylalanyl-tRNA synthetase beta chain
MPTIEVSHKDLCKLIGKDLSMEDLTEAANFAKSGIEGTNGDLITIKVEDTNRPDLWSAEGVAREIRGRMVRGGCPRYDVRESGVVVNIDKKNKDVRPYTVCAVVKDLNIDENVLSQMIQLQEKVCGTFGRNRSEVALGVYDFDRIKPPIRFTTVKPEGIMFVPLDFDRKMTPKEILEEHPKGKEYAHLLSGFDEYPIFIDSRDEVLSVPPIINSNYSGKVTDKTKNLFIECSGFNLKFLMPALNVLVTAMAERGGRIESVNVVLPGKTLVTPDLSPRSSWVGIDYVNEISGLSLSGKEICKLLEKANYDAELKGKKIEVKYPAYRQDIMHQRDIVEDVIISYGYNNVGPVTPELKTTGGMDKMQIFSDKVAGIMNDLGFQEIMQYTLTNKSKLFERMNLKEVRIVEIENPSSENWSVFRNWLLPGMMEFLAGNQHVSYPQKIFEIGNTVLVDKNEEMGTRDSRKIAAAISDSKIGYQDMLAVLDSLMSKLGQSYNLKAKKHPSFIEGRVASVLVKGREIGEIGEVHPSVLENWKMQMPTVAFEIDIDDLS